jgi:type III restriction enzyme
MAKRSWSASLDFAFFTHLYQFHRENKGRIRTYYRELSRKFLDYNDPENAGSFLRTPQFEALEIYIFLKEFLDNEPVHELFRAWSAREGRFEGRTAAARAGQQALFDLATKEDYSEVYQRMRSQARPYANYIFALTMGTGKTILMATCIFYEFILANKFPKDGRYCHNALVFAPDKTVLQSLREIQTFDMAKVVPPEYVHWLIAHVQFHFLDQTGMALSTIDRSRFNIIISNVQKVILKRQSKERSATDQLFGSGPATYQAESVYAQNADLYGFDEPENEDDLVTNQRFEKLRRLEQLGIYIDEAHHAFGTKLAKDVGAQKDTGVTSLRNTVDELAASLKRSGTQMVACYNYTGTPYVGQEVLPEVVYAYGLQEAIKFGYLKTVQINGYAHTRTTEFIDIVLGDFLARVGNERHEGMLPKIAFFAATIEELQKELRPTLEAALAKHGIPASQILVNVGDDSITSNDDIREFNRLDTPGSEKRFILLVGKGKEGWNCRSLFGVALYRRPKSKIFVLQSTMRCLRSIGEAQQTGHVYLSEENREILDDELQQNFRVTIEDVNNIGKDRVRIRVQVNEPIPTVKLRRVQKLFRMREKKLEGTIDLQLKGADRERYRLIHTQQEGLGSRRPRQVKDLTHMRQQRRFSRLTLVAEIAKYLNMACLQIEGILERTREGIGDILEAVNEFNELLYDWIIPRLFNELYQIDQFENHEDHEVELVRKPSKGYYEISAAPEMIVAQTGVNEAEKGKSFHLDSYCFDSNPERELFWRLLRDKRVSKIYFTGMLTHGQSEFFVHYIDPESHTVRSYYPDFLLQKEDGSLLIIEVKGDNKIDDPVVQAKHEYTRQMAGASSIGYEMIRGSDALKGNYGFLFANGSAQQPHPEGLGLM